MSGGNVVNFPTGPVRDWALIERAMREEFRLLAMPESAQATLVGIMKSFHDLLDFQLNLSVDVSFPGTISRRQAAAVRSQIGEGLSAQCTEQLNGLKERLFVERLGREVDLARELGLW
jgi:hypothetical protein